MKAISNLDGLYSVLPDVVNEHPDLIDRFLDNALIDLGSVELLNTPIPVWPALADHDVFPLTFENVRSYIQEVGEIDISLGRYLSKVGAVSVAGDVAQADRQKLALEILSAESTIPNPGQRVALVQSLELENYLLPTSLPSESGNLIGLLIGSEVLEDNAASYGLTLAHDWATKESAILASNEFVRFMNPAQIPISDVPNLLRSTKIASAIKDTLIERFDEFIPSNDTEALKATAEYVVATKKKLSFDKVSRISAANVGQELTANVLALGLFGITADQLAQLAGDFGSWLKKLLARDGTRPKIENTEANKAIAEHLKELDQVSSIEDKGREVQVNLKKS